MSDKKQTPTQRDREHKRDDMMAERIKRIWLETNLDDGVDMQLAVGAVVASEIARLRLER